MLVELAPLSKEYKSDEELAVVPAPAAPFAAPLFFFLVQTNRLIIILIINIKPKFISLLDSLI